jgi:phenylacetate-CoA ligase
MIPNNLFHYIKFNKSQWKNKKIIKKNQFKAIKSIISYSYKNIPFYNKLYKEKNIKPCDIKTFKDINKIPIITKKDVILNYPNNIVNNNKYQKKLYHSSTSGSTGTPIEIMFNNNCRSVYEALWLRTLLETDYKPWNKFAFFHWKQFNKIPIYEKFGILRKNIILMDLKISKQIKLLNKINPSYIYCFSSLFKLIYQKMKTKNEILINPKSIILTGETISKKFKNRIGQFYNSEIFEQYATTEFEIVAWDCKEHKHFHINDESVYLEIIKNNEVIQSEEDGNIIITGLTNYAMPLIRYNINDYGSKTNEKCNCGRELSLLKSIQGRTDDFIKLPNGNRISPSVLTSYIEIGDEFYKYVSQFKIIQKKIDKIIIKIVKKKDLDENFLILLKKRLIKITNNQINISIKEINNIPISKRGKIKVIESRI